MVYEPVASIWRFLFLLGSSCFNAVRYTFSTNIFRQALETRDVQFKVPGLQTFELDLDVATAVRALPKFRTWIKMVICPISIFGNKATDDA